MDPHVRIGERPGETMAGPANSQQGNGEEMDNEIGRTFKENGVPVVK